MPLKAPATNQPGPAMSGPSIQLPPGDWCLFFDASIPTAYYASGNQGQIFFALGALSDTSITDNNTLVFSGFASSSLTGGVFNRNYALHGSDKNGLQIGNLNATNILSSGTTPKIMILTCGGQDQFDGVRRTFWIERRSNRISVWRASDGGEPLEVARSRRNLKWAGFAAPVPLTLFSNNMTAAGTVGGRSWELGRFGFVGRATTMNEKRLFVQGADPVALMSMAAPDLYWPLANTAAIANGTVIADVVQGANLTANWTTWLAPTTVTPTALVEGARVLCPEANHVYSATQKTGGTIEVNGGFNVVDPLHTVDVQIRAVDSVTPATVIADWQTIATNVTGNNQGLSSARSSGGWTGNFAIDMGRRWMRWEVRLVVDTVAQASTVLLKPFGVGVGVVAAGQSIVKQGLGITAVGQGTGANSGYHSTFQHSPPSETDGDQNYQATQSLLKSTSGMGMNLLGNALSTLLDCCVITSCPAKSGASIGTYARFDDQFENLDFAIDTMRKTGAAVLLWNQGNSPAPSSGNLYFDDLEELYRKLNLGIGRPFKFGILPLGDDVNIAQSAFTCTVTRQAQRAWVRYSRNLGRDVFLVGSINDIDNSDDTHPQTTVAGAGRIAARIAQTVASLCDKTITSGVGPAIVGAVWDGNLTIKVKIKHNGGTALKSVQHIKNINLVTYPEGVGPINNGLTLTGWEVCTSLLRSSGRPVLRIDVTNAVISSANEITLTLATKPAKMPWVTYLEGKPGWAAPTDTADVLKYAAITNLVFDNRVSQVSPSLGFPLEFTAEPVRCVPLLVPVVNGLGVPLAGSPVPIVAGWGVHPQGQLVTPAH